VLCYCVLCAVCKCDSPTSGVYVASYSLSVIQYAMSCTELPGRLIQPVWGHQQFQANCTIIHYHPGMERIWNPSKKKKTIIALFDFSLCNNIDSNLHDAY